MKHVDISGSGLAPVINLSGEDTSEALAAASLCEAVRVKVVNLTPSSGPVVVPVRFVSEPITLPIDFLEEVVENGLATKAEFRFLRKLCAILES